MHHVLVGKHSTIHNKTKPFIIRASHTMRQELKKMNAMIQADEESCDRSSKQEWKPNPGLQQVHQVFFFQSRDHAKPQLKIISLTKSKPKPSMLGIKAKPISSSAQTLAFQELITKIITKAKPTKKVRQNQQTSVLKREIDNST